MNCYKFNSGKDSLGNFQKLLKTPNLEQGSELRLVMNLTIDTYILYQIKNNSYNPTGAELKFLVPNAFVDSTIRKTIDEKLPKPYNPCRSIEFIKTFDSELVKGTIQKHETYRQVNCYDLCYQKYLESLAASKNISLMEAFHNTSDFNRNNKCDHSCPLECDSIYFDISSVERSLSDQDFDYYKKQYLNNSNGYKKENMLVVKVQYDTMSDTHMTQTAKMSFADLISNIGGVLGVFLETSFFSIYRTLERLI